MLKLKLQYLATSCEELTHWKRLWCWEGLGAGGEGDDRGWDGWMASPTWWTWVWVWVNSGSWWWTGKPGVLWFMGSQRVGHDWATELNWEMQNGSSFGLFVCRIRHIALRSGFASLLSCFAGALNQRNHCWEIKGCPFSESIDYFAALLGTFNSTAR